MFTISGILAQLEVKLRDHGNLRGEVSTITLHMEQKEEKERLARQRVENLEVGKRVAAGDAFDRLFFLPRLDDQLLQTLAENPRGRAGKWLLFSRGLSGNVPLVETRAKHPKPTCNNRNHKNQETNSAAHSPPPSACPCRLPPPLTQYAT